jgi:hypothetical protein
LENFIWKVDSDQNEKGAAILSDEALKEIAAGVSKANAQFMAEGLFKQMTDLETGVAGLETGYSRDDSIAALKAAFRTFKIREDTPPG